MAWSHGEEAGVPWMAAGDGELPARSTLQDHLIMLHFGEEECTMHLPFLCCFYARQHHPRGLASWIDLERDGLQDAVFNESGLLSATRGWFEQAHVFYAWGR